MKQDQRRHQKASKPSLKPNTLGHMTHIMVVSGTLALE